MPTFYIEVRELLSLLIALLLLVLKSVELYRDIQKQSRLVPALEYEHCTNVGPQFRLRVHCRGTQQQTIEKVFMRLTSGTLLDPMEPLDRPVVLHNQQYLDCQFLRYDHLTKTWHAAQDFCEVRVVDVAGKVYRWPGGGLRGYLRRRRFLHEIAEQLANAQRPK